MTAPPPPRVHAGDSDPSIPEALHRVRHAHQERPQLPTVPGLHVRHRVRGFVAQMTASPVTLSVVRQLVGTVPVVYGADSEAAGTAQLVVSELISNAVRACGDGSLLVVEVHATSGGGIALAVHDPAGHQLPTRCTAVMDSDVTESGRGLLLLDVLAPGWRVERSPLGKQLRCHIRGASADQGCICGKPADDCTCKDHPWPGKRTAAPPTACDWCGQRDHDPIKPQDDDFVPTTGADMTAPGLGQGQPVGVSA
ncbi:ATP-binding protein [Streptomyces sp. NEAU-174]|uniref:ATP-binding protein n=1 Tax=Streptomyces sp. NEAU-174 TaxID=3458254 RepID=UPI0040443C16